MKGGGGKEGRGGRDCRRFYHNCKINQGQCFYSNYWMIQEVDFDVFYNVVMREDKCLCKRHN